MAVGLNPSQVLRFSDLYQILDTGVDVVWTENGAPSGGPGWIIRETYVQTNLATGEITQHTEDMITAEAHDIPEVVKTVYLRIAGRALDHVLSEIGV
jgi:hypothetical protein